MVVSIQCFLLVRQIFVVIFKDHWRLDYLCNVLLAPSEYFVSDLRFYVTISIFGQVFLSLLQPFLFNGLCTKVNEVFDFLPIDGVGFIIPIIVS